MNLNCPQYPRILRFLDQASAEPSNVVRTLAYGRICECAFQAAAGKDVADHQSKHIREAIRHAERNGWTLKESQWPCSYLGNSLVSPPSEGRVQNSCDVHTPRPGKTRP